MHEDKNVIIYVLKRLTTYFPYQQCGEMKKGNFFSRKSELRDTQTGESKGIVKRKDLYLALFMIMTFTADEKEIKKLYIRYSLVINGEKYLILGEMYSYTYLPTIHLHYLYTHIEFIYLVVNSVSFFSLLFFSKGFYCSGVPNVNTGFIHRLTHAEF